MTRCWAKATKSPTSPSVVGRSCHPSHCEQSNTICSQPCTRYSPTDSRTHHHQDVQRDKTEACSFSPEHDAVMRRFKVRRCNAREQMENLNSEQREERSSLCPPPCHNSLTAAASHRLPIVPGFSTTFDGAEVTHSKPNFHEPV